MARHIVLNTQNQPYRDPDAAAAKAAILTKELGIEYVAIPYQSGWAVTTAAGQHKTSPDSATPASDRYAMIVLRPAWRAYLAELFMVVCGVVAAAAVLYFAPAAESFIRIDPGSIAGRSFPWLQQAVGWAPRALVAGCLVFAGYGLFRMTIASSGIYANKYVIGATHIDSYTGFILCRKDSIRIDDIRSVRTDQSMSLLQRVLGYGDMEYSTAGSAGAEIIFRKIARPAFYERAVEQRRLLRPERD